jgi:DNA polymerase-3 subunit epsilon
MYLFFDTETTGLPKKWKAPVTDLDNWPRLVQIAWLTFSEEGRQMEEGSFIIKPDGFVIPEDAARIHGITMDRAGKEGAPLPFVLEQFQSVVNLADTLVAHNISFDEKIVGAEFLRNNLPNVVSGKNKICTMESSKEFCALSGQYGLKWPRLSELHHKLFGEDFAEAHNAVNDIRATAKCFWELRRIGII